ncbi:unnamed protein product [Toxocara canis]|nr:unnamed protein product [Toxocara canis]
MKRRTLKGQAVNNCATAEPKKLTDTDFLPLTSRQALALFRLCIVMQEESKPTGGVIHNCQFEHAAEIVKVFSFVPFGLGSVICNSIIIAAITSHNGLRNRREFQIINALAIADFVEGFATFLGGLYRIVIVATGMKNYQFTPLECMMLPQSWMWRWSDTATAFMLLILSLDRLVSVLAPLRYFQLGVNYIRFMIGVPYITSLMSAVVAWIYPLNLWGTLSMMCMTREFISPVFYQYSKYSSSAASALSVIVYIPLLCAMRSQLKTISHKISFTQIDRKRKAQLRVTATIALSSLSTLFLDSLPRAVGMYGMVEEMRSEEPRCDSVFMYLFLLSKVNSMFNLLLYYLRHRTMRAAIKRIFTCSGPVLR